MSMARDSWESMQGGYGSWSDCYIPHDDFETQKRLNEELQSYCAHLSALSDFLTGDGSLPSLSYHSTNLS